MEQIAKGTRSTKDYTERRRVALQNIINDLHKERRHITEKILLEKLDAKGYKIKRSSLYEDRVALAKENTFIRDLAESSYSQVIEEVYNDITLIKEKCLALAEKDWVRRLIKEKPTGAIDKDGKPVVRVERLIEENESAPKQNFYALALKCDEQIMNLMRGDLLNVSVALLARKLDHYRSEIELLKQKERDKDAASAIKALQDNTTEETSTD